MAHDDASPGYQLGRLREQVGLKQADIAARMTVSPARISRIESGDSKLTTEEIEQYLAALGTDEARAFSAYLRQDWGHQPRPPFDHPDRDALWHAAEIERRLDELLEDPNLKGVFVRQVQLYKEELSRQAAYLLSRDHKIALIGVIGVGKSTAICQVTNLLLTSPDKKKLIQQVVLETGSGRTTICEVHVKQGPQYGILLEPRSEEAIRQDVNDYCDYLLNEGVASGEKKEAPAISEETIRAISNMARILRGKRKEDGNQFIHAKELASQYPDARELQIQILDRMNLPRRQLRDIWYPEEAKDNPLEWLKKTFEDINNGRHADFSLPQRLEVVVPEPVLETTELTLRIVDTKGIDQTANRLDLECHFDEPRTVTVLCSAFATAPDPVIQKLLERALQVGVTPASLIEGTMILVLPRNDEAVVMKDEYGMRVDTDEEGYRLKKDQIDLGLHHLGLGGLRSYFFNAISDDPKALRAALLQQVQGRRDEARRRIANLGETVHALIENLEKEQIRIILEAAFSRLRTWLTTNRELGVISSRAETALLAEVENSHQRTLWASVRRNGQWHSLNYYYHLGVGARRLAAQYFKEKLSALEAVVQNLLDSAEFSPAHDFLQQFKFKISDENNTVLKRIHLAGWSAFEKDLRLDAAFWLRCNQEYGRGGPYIHTVHGYTKAWFDDEARFDAHSRVTREIEAGWKQIIDLVERLLAEAAPV